MNCFNYSESREIESREAASIVQVMVEKIATMRRAHMVWLISNRFAVAAGLEDGEPVYRLASGLLLGSDDFFAREWAVLDSASRLRPGDDCTRLRLAAAVLVVRYRATLFGQRVALRQSRLLAA